MKFNYKTLGILLIVFSSLGLLISLAGITLSWIVKPGIQKDILAITNSIDATLANTGEGLVVIDNALGNVNSNLEILVSTLDNLDGTFNGISSSLDSSADLVGDDLRQTIIETQIALSSAASSAELIDRTLLVISRIPFIGADYQPEVPLHTSLDSVAGSLDDIPGTLETMESSLTTTSEGLGLLNENLMELSNELGKFETDLEKTQGVLNEYQNIIADAQETLMDFRNKLPGNLTLLTIFITGFLFSLAVAQCITLFQGIAFIQGEKQVVNLADIRRE